MRLPTIRQGTTDSLQLHRFVTARLGEAIGRVVLLGSGPPLTCKCKRCEACRSCLGLERAVMWEDKRNRKERPGGGLAVGSSKVTATRAGAMPSTNPGRRPAKRAQLVAANQGWRAWRWSCATAAASAARKSYADTAGRGSTAGTWCCGIAGRRCDGGSAARRVAELSHPREAD